MNQTDLFQSIAIIALAIALVMTNLSIKTIKDLIDKL